MQKLLEETFLFDNSIQDNDVAYGQRWSLIQTQMNKIISTDNFKGSKQSPKKKILVIKNAKMNEQKIINNRLSPPHKKIDMDDKLIEKKEIELIKQKQHKVLDGYKINEMQINQLQDKSKVKGSKNSIIKLQLLLLQNNEKEYGMSQQNSKYLKNKKQNINKQKSVDLYNKKASYKDYNQKFDKGNKNKKQINNRDQNIDRIDENDSKLIKQDNDENMYDRKRVSFELLQITDDRQGIQKMNSRRKSKIIIRDRVLQRNKNECIEQDNKINNEYMINKQNNIECGINISNNRKNKQYVNRFDEGQQFQRYQSKQNQLNYIKQKIKNNHHSIINHNQSNHISNNSHHISNHSNHISDNSKHISNKLINLLNKNKSQSLYQKQHQIQKLLQKQSIPKYSKNTKNLSNNNISLLNNNKIVVTNNKNLSNKNISLSNKNKSSSKQYLVLNFKSSAQYKQQINQFKKLLTNQNTLNNNNKLSSKLQAINNTNSIQQSNIHQINSQSTNIFPSIQKQYNNQKQQNNLKSYINKKQSNNQKQSNLKNISTSRISPINTKLKPNSSHQTYNKQKSQRLDHPNHNIQKQKIKQLNLILQSHKLNKNITQINQLNQQNQHKQLQHKLQLKSKQNKQIRKISLSQILNGNIKIQYLTNKQISNRQQISKSCYFTQYKCPNNKLQTIQRTNKILSQKSSTFNQNKQTKYKLSKFSQRKISADLLTCGDITLKNKSDSFMKNKKSQFSPHKQIKSNINNKYTQDQTQQINAKEINLNQQKIKNTNKQNIKQDFTIKKNLDIQKNFSLMRLSINKNKNKLVIIRK